LGILLPLVIAGQNSRPVPTSENPTKESAIPLVIKDGKTGAIYYVEGDRQHISAITSDGKLSWHVNLVKVAGIKSALRNGVPVVIPGIIKVEEAPREWSEKHLKGSDKKGEFLWIIFNTRDSGVVSKVTGDFSSTGRD
jgi:hypothetical protein